MATPEWMFQRAAVTYLSTVLPLGSEIQGHDTRGKQTARARQLDVARGIKAGWPDLVCEVADFPPIYIELKAPAGRLSDEQHRRGMNLRRLGRIWFVAQTLEQIEVELVTLGVPLRGHTLTAAERDAKIAEKAAAKPKAPAKPRAPRGNRKQVARWNTAMLAMAKGCGI